MGLFKATAEEVAQTKTLEDEDLTEKIRGAAGEESLRRYLVGREESLDIETEFLWVDGEEEQGGLTEDIRENKIK